MLAGPCRQAAVAYWPSSCQHAPASCRSEHPNGSRSVVPRRRDERPGAARHQPRRSTETRMFPRSRSGRSFAEAGSIVRSMKTTAKHLVWQCCQFDAAISHSWMASRMLRNASSRVWPWLQQPGKAGQLIAKPSSDFINRTLYVIWLTASQRFLATEYHGKFPLSRRKSIR